MTVLFIFKHPDLSLIVIGFSFAHPELKCNSPALPCDCCSASGDKMLPQIKHKCFHWHHSEELWLNVRGLSVTPCMDSSAVGWAWMSNLRRMQRSVVGKDVFLLVFATGFSVSIFCVFSSHRSSVSASLESTPTSVLGRHWTAMLPTPFCFRIAKF